MTPPIIPPTSVWASMTHYHFARVASTQESARMLLAQRDHVPGFVVTAESQSAGVGRMQRRWRSPPGNLAMSMVLEDSPILSKIVSYLVGVAVYRAIDQTARSASITLDMRLKWPNDLMLQGAKCAGILIERHLQPRAVLIVGIGVNQRSSPKGMPYPVGCLAEQGLELAPEVLAKRIVEQSMACLADVGEHGEAKLLTAWQALAHPLGTRLRVRTLKEDFVGEYLGLAGSLADNLVDSLTNSGVLRVRDEEGRVREIWAADCFLLSSDEVSCD